MVRRVAVCVAVALLAFAYVAEPEIRKVPREGHQIFFAGCNDPSGAQQDNYLQFGNAGSGACQSGSSTGSSTRLFLPFDGAVGRMKCYMTNGPGEGNTFEVHLRVGANSVNSCALSGAGELTCEDGRLAKYQAQQLLTMWFQDLNSNGEGTDAGGFTCTFEYLF